jgi:hypothetical protein
MDRQWWDIYYHEVAKEFIGDLFSCNPVKYQKVTSLNRNNFKSFGNSGADAISLAVHGEAKKIILLGYDCQKTNNQSHWHGDHVKGLGNANRIDIWPKKFEALAEWSANVPIINASKETALNCFQKMSLDEALSD